MNEALRLADELDALMDEESLVGAVTIDRAAAELRRLHAALAEPEQEPVAWAVYDILHGGSKTLHWPEQHSPNGDPKQYKAVPLYTAPTPRKPLTDEEIRGLADKHLFYQPEGYEVSGIFNFARAIERAHGIGEPT